ncbi:EamA family transporter [Colwellia psychrerythraea]|uniref:EamA family transporter n=1 Tax=Colwellia psychrerythraea TaxID=28229 RepID=A0A1Y5ERG7_COLPS|nr:EamA family transporter [Colwellia psychrerythraea]
MFLKNETSGGVINVVLASFLWGTTGTVASLTPDVSPLATGAFSVGFGGLLLLINARKSLVHDLKKLIYQSKLLFLGGLSVAIYPLAFYTSMKWSGVAIGTVISIASAPFFTVVLERLISKKNVSLQWGVSFIFGALGVLLLTLGKQRDMSFVMEVTTQYWGIVLGLIAGLTYATYSWAAKQLIDNGISSKSSMASMFGISAIFLLPSLFVTGDNLFATTTNSVLALYMAIVPMFLGYLLFGLGLRHIAASKATLITLLEPVVATLLAIVIVGESFNFNGWLGLFFITLCLMFQMIKLPKISKPSPSA